MAVTKSSVFIDWCSIGTYFTWSDDILSCEVTKLLMLGLKNLAMFDSHMWKQRWQWQPNMPLSSNTPQDDAIISRTGVTTSASRWPMEKPRLTKNKTKKNKSYIDVLLQHPTTINFTQQVIKYSQRGENASLFRNGMVWKTDGLKACFFPYLLTTMNVSLGEQGWYWTFNVLIS